MDNVAWGRLPDLSREGGHHEEIASCIDGDAGAPGAGASGRYGREGAAAGGGGSGGFCGGQLGHNFQRDRLVFSIEGDLSLPWFKASRGALDGSDLKVSETRYDWIGTLTARAGLTFDRSLFYVKGGAAVARIRNSEFEAGGDPVDASTTTNTKWGWTLGGGAEFAWSPNWSFKVEYLHMNFGSATSIRPDDNAFDYRNRLNTVKVGVNYRWGAAPVSVRY